MIDFVALVFASGLLLWAVPRETGTKIFCAVAILQGASLLTTALYGVK